MDIVASIIVSIVVLVMFFVLAWKMFSGKKRRNKNFERSLKMVPMLIHLPPRTDDIQGGGRDERDVTNEEISQSQVMYNIISSTLTKGLKSKLYGQKHISFEIVAHEGLINYYAIVPAVMTETLKQAITAAYPSARLEEVHDPNFFSKNGGLDAVVGGELELKDDYWYPIASYEDTKRDASLALINALSVAKKGDGIGVQIMFRPCEETWTRKSLERVQNLRDGKKSRSHGAGSLGKIVDGMGNLVGDLAEALWKPPDPHDPYKQEEKVLTNLEQEEIQRIEEKTKYPGFQVLVRFVASSDSKTRSTALIGGVVSVFSQFDLQNYNGFKYNAVKRSRDLVKDYILRTFPQEQNKFILNSVEMASIFHLPSQNAIPTSQVERQLIKQVDGPAKLADEGVILGVNKFRGEEKIIRLRTKDRRRHTYVIGATGMGKSILLTNIAYQDICDGRGLAFIDPHGDAAELLLSKIPPERMDDVIYFEPGNMEQPVGMNMFEFRSEDEKDFIVQEAINMLVSLYDPGNQGIFGARAQHMFRNAALLLMSDPNGGTFIDVPRCFTDPEFVKSKLKYVTDKTVYDYWTKEFPASQKSNDAGEVTSWFVSKWGPFLSNKMMRNILGQTKSGFNIREIMDNKKILLINLSKGKTGELNAKLLGMIFVMKFQAAAMSRADTPEDEREDFCLFVDEFQNFSTESFESILSEARKYRLNLVLANQFMTQLTDKIREAILGNVGTIMSGRLGVTDAELMEKAFAPVFNAEDLHAMPNYSAIATVMMFDMPTSPFTMSLLPPMGESSNELMVRMKAYASSKHGRPRADVEREIEARLAATPVETPKPTPANNPMANSLSALDGASRKMPPATPANAPKPAAAKPEAPKKNFLDAWLERKSANDAAKKEEGCAAVIEKQHEAVAPKPAASKPAVTTSAKPQAVPVQAQTAPKVTPVQAQTAPKVTPVQTQAVPQVASMQSQAAPMQQKAQPVEVAPKSDLSGLDNLQINTGSVWAAKAAENAERASAAEVQQAVAADAVEKTDSTIFTIHHDIASRDKARARRAERRAEVLGSNNTVPQPPVAQPVNDPTQITISHDRNASQGQNVAPQSPNTGSVAQVQQEEDPTVLRWR